MNKAAIQQAVQVLVDARRTGELPEQLPQSCQPATVDEAHAIQDATIATLGEIVAGWKVGTAPDGQLVRGVLLQSRVFSSPAYIAAADVPLLGIESEIAFRFDRDLPAREAEYGYSEVSDAVTALPAIEIVDSRFCSYPDAPFLDRVADFVSNGAFVYGDLQRKWREFDLTKIHIQLTFDDEVIIERNGGHPTTDPLLPAIALVNALRRHIGVHAGQFMTTGTYTGLNFAKSRQSAIASFLGFGTAVVRFNS